ncbi:MAG: hypothetical protein ACTSUF_04325 [Candidatus Heimdallarchaeaceae archaeon]
MSEVKDLHRDIVKEMFWEYDFEFEIESYDENEFEFQIKQLWGGVWKNERENNRIYIVLKEDKECKLVSMETNSDYHVFLGWYYPDESKGMKFIPSRDFWETMFLEHLQ